MATIITQGLKGKQLVTEGFGAAGGGGGGGGGGKVGKSFGKGGGYLQPAVAVRSGPNGSGTGRPI